METVLTIRSIDRSCLGSEGSHTNYSDGSRVTATNLSGFVKCGNGSALH